MSDGVIKEKSYKFALDIIELYDGDLKRNR
jgi:hypothetical protein